MKGFLIGILAGIAGLAGSVFMFLRLGLLSPSAARPPSTFESKEAMKFLDAAVTRRAPGQGSRLAASDEDLLVGLRLYEAHCALCHGDPANPSSAIGLAFYPRAPQFLQDAPDMPENQNFYIVKNGIRWTGMPGWGKVLSKEQVWKLTSFLAHMRDLPLAVEQEWKPAHPAKSSTPAMEERGANRHE